MSDISVNVAESAVTSKFDDCNRLSMFLRYCGPPILMDVSMAITGRQKFVTPYDAASIIKHIAIHSQD